MSKGNILSGMRSTGRLHLGHLSVLENWRKLQDEYRCYFMVANWHALTTAFDETEGNVENIRQMVLDWLMVGLDPECSSIFVQSEVKEHAELHLLLSMITPNSWLERCPTYKDQVQQFRDQGKDITTYGFLGYPLLMASDILIYQASVVPVGEDQLPHLEFTREVARRFNNIYKTNVFPEPQAYLAEIAMVPGTDGRKMSKSYGNHIPLASTPEEVLAKLRTMVTDPARIHAKDHGHPDVCTIYAFQRLFNQAGAIELDEVCRKGEIGCVACKKLLGQKLVESMNPYWERRRQFEQDPDYVWDVLRQGACQARQRAGQTMAEVRTAMKLELPSQTGSL
jgi:tryptophanyl-tRNA synthetase